MKKWYLLLVATVALFLLCACPNTAVGNTEDPAPAPAPEPTPEVEISYNDVERHPSLAHKGIPFGFSGDAFLLVLSCPNEWTLCKSGESYEILRDEVVIGHLGEEETLDGNVWKTLVTDEASLPGVSVTKSIQSIGAGADVDYRYRYDYVYRDKDEQRTLTLTVALSEVDEKSEGKLFTNAVMLKNTTSETVGILSERLGGAPSILILGNSFIGTSRIGDVLREMLRVNEKNGQVTAISRSYATVATYIGDAALMESIRNGVYDAVFICGFYSSTEVMNLGALKRACDESQTELVIFPAHNENAAHIESARSTYPSLVCLHWKDEIEGLIADGGVSRWDLCIDDAYDHSTPLAGYVGAHMIYRAIYDELPKEPMYSIISQTYIDAILFDYAYVGDAQYMIAKEDITYLD